MLWEFRAQWKKIAEKLSGSWLCFQGSSLCRDEVSVPPQEEIRQFVTNRNGFSMIKFKYITLPSAQKSVKSTKK